MTYSLAHAKQLNIDWLNGDERNTRIGDFIWTHTVEKQEWVVFRNTSGDCVSYGGIHKTEVHILIKQASRDRLERVMYFYLHKLAGRHGGRILHTSGSKDFKYFTIRLPFVVSTESDVLISIVPGSNGVYQQEDLAYEVIAALSKIPAYKEVSPMFYFGNFVRLDDVHDNTWIEYCYKDQGISVTFSHTKDPSHLIVKKDSFPKEGDKERFKALMARLFIAYVQEKTGRVFVLPHGFGTGTYGGGHRPFSVEVFVEETPSLYSISVGVHYRDYEHWPRAQLARQLMEAISQAYPMEKTA